MSWQPTVNWLHQGKTLHLNHGPIDLLICCEGLPDAVADGFAVAQETFATVLVTLVEELEVLRTAVSSVSLSCTGPVAQRMVAACKPFAAYQVTPMAAVAGAVADHVLHKLSNTPGVSRAWINNGGDIALYLTEGQQFDCGIVSNLKQGDISGQFQLSYKDFTGKNFTGTHGVGGVATSGRASSGDGGRSFSLGIADSVTVLASSAATADVAATLIANHVDLPGHSAITRTAANLLDPDSDLRDRKVTTAVGKLSEMEIKQALQRGWVLADELRQQNHIHSALLSLRGHYRRVQAAHLLSEIA